MISAGFDAPGKLPPWQPAHRNLPQVSSPFCQIDSLGVGAGVGVGVGDGVGLGVGAGVGVGVVGVVVPPATAVVSGVLEPPPQAVNVATTKAKINFIHILS